MPVRDDPFVALLDDDYYSSSSSSSSSAEGDNDVLRLAHAALGASALASERGVEFDPVILDGLVRRASIRLRALRRRRVLSSFLFPPPSRAGSTTAVSSSAAAAAAAVAGELYRVSSDCLDVKMTGGGGGSTGPPSRRRGPGDDDDVDHPEFDASFSIDGIFFFRPLY